jgi:hypothetical protein
MGFGRYSKLPECARKKAGSNGVKDNIFTAFSVCFFSLN